MATILIVDDMKTDRELLGKVVAQAGHTPVYASDGDEVPARFAETSPQLVFLDVVMPRVNGYSACRTLKQNEASKGVPVVLVTSKSAESDRFWAQKQGADDVVGKPFTTEGILAVLKRYL